MSINQDQMETHNLSFHTSQDKFELKHTSSNPDELKQENMNTSDIVNITSEKYNSDQIDQNLLTTNLFDNLKTSPMQKYNDTDIVNLDVSFPISPLQKNIKDNNQDQTDQSTEFIWKDKADDYSNNTINNNFEKGLSQVNFETEKEKNNIDIVNNDIVKNNEEKLTQNKMNNNINNLGSKNEFITSSNNKDQIDNKNNLNSKQSSISKSFQKDTTLMENLNKIEFDKAEQIQEFGDVLNHVVKVDSDFFGNMKQSIEDKLFESPTKESLYLNLNELKNRQLNRSSSEILRNASNDKDINNDDKPILNLSEVYSNTKAKYIKSNSSKKNMKNSDKLQLKNSAEIDNSVEKMKSLISRNNILEKSCKDIKHNLLKDEFLKQFNQYSEDVDKLELLVESLRTCEDKRSSSIKKHDQLYQENGVKECRNSINRILKQKHIEQIEQEQCKQFKNSKNQKKSNTDKSSQYDKSFTHLESNNVSNVIDSNNSNNSINIDREKLYDKLYNSHKELRDKRLREKHFNDIKEEARMKKECTFKPEKYTEGNLYEVNSKFNVYNSQSKLQKLEMIKKMQESQYTFSPTINERENLQSKTNSSFTKDKVYDRLYNLSKNKIQDNIQKIKVDEKVNKSFVPAHKEVKYQDLDTKINQLREKYKINSSEKKYQIPKQSSLLHMKRNMSDNNINLNQINKESISSKDLFQMQEQISENFDEFYSKSKNKPLKTNTDSDKFKDRSNYQSKRQTSEKKNNDNDLKLEVYENKLNNNLINNSMVKDRLNTGLKKAICRSKTPLNNENNNRFKLNHVRKIDQGSDQKNKKLINEQPLSELFTNLKSKVRSQSSCQRDQKSDSNIEMRRNESQTNITNQINGNKSTTLNNSLAEQIGNKNNNNSFDSSIEFPKLSKSLANKIHKSKTSSSVECKVPEFKYVNKIESKASEPKTFNQRQQEMELKKQKKSLELKINQLRVEDKNDFSFRPSTNNESLSDKRYDSKKFSILTEDWSRKHSLNQLNMLNKKISSDLEIKPTKGLELKPVGQPAIEKSNVDISQFNLKLF